jgi:LysM repeat protein
VNFASVLLRWLAILLCGLSCVGCWENTDNPLNEQKEAYYLRGKSLESSLDWPGAVAAYRKALEVNPRNASAHFELWILNQQRILNYAAAIYHAECFLELRPKSEFAQIVRQGIVACKTELAKNVPIGPVTPALQRDFERVTTTNKVLLQQIDQLTQRLAIAGNQIQLLNQRLALATNRPPPVAADRPIAPLTNQIARPSPGLTNRTVRPSVFNAQVPTPTPAKTHLVKGGETMVSIARKNGVSLHALEKANPGIEPRRLKAGQVLKVPAP